MRSFRNKSCSQKKVRYLFSGQFLGFFESFRRAELELWTIYSRYIRNKWNCRTSCTKSERRNFVSIGSLWTSGKVVGRNNAVLLLSSDCARLQAEDGQTPYERRFNSPFDGPITLFGGEVKFYPIYCKDQSRVHHFGTKVLPGMFMGYALNVARGWTGDLFITNTKHLKTMPPNQKEVDIPEKDNFVFPCRTGEILQEGQLSSTVVYHAECDLRQWIQGKPSDEEEKAWDPSPDLEAR